MMIEKSCLNAELNGLVTIADRCRKKGDLKAAETLLQHALSKAEERFGLMSVPVACVLLELVALHEESNNPDAAKLAHSRMRQIILTLINSNEQN